GVEEPAAVPAQARARSAAEPHAVPIQSRGVLVARSEQPHRADAAVDVHVSAPRGGEGGRVASRASDESGPVDRRAAMPAGRRPERRRREEAAHTPEDADAVAPEDADEPASDRLEPVSRGERGAPEEPALRTVEGEEAPARSDEEDPPGVGVEGGGPDAAREDGRERAVAVPEEERPASSSRSLGHQSAGAGEAERILADADP